MIDDAIEEKPDTDENEIICWHDSHAKGRCVKGINIRPLSKPLIQFQIIDPSNQIETKCKSFSSIAIAVSNDLKSFQHSNHVLVNYSITR